MGRPHCRRGQQQGHARVAWRSPPAMAFATGSGRPQGSSTAARRSTPNWRGSLTAPARSGGAGGLHAHPDRGFRAPLRGAPAQHSPLVAAGLPGLHTHERAIEAGCKLAGATVHLVTPELDHGPIVIQAAVPVLDDDTGDTLSARVLRQSTRFTPRRTVVCRRSTGGIGRRSGQPAGAVSPRWCGRPDPAAAAVGG